MVSEKWEHLALSVLWFLGSWQSEAVFLEVFLEQTQNDHGDPQVPHRELQKGWSVAVSVQHLPALVDPLHTQVNQANVVFTPVISVEVTPAHFQWGLNGFLIDVQGGIFYHPSFWEGYIRFQVRHWHMLFLAVPCLLVQRMLQFVALHHCICVIIITVIYRLMG